MRQRFSRSSLTLSHCVTQQIYFFKKQLLKSTLTFFTFSTLQLRTQSIRDVVGGVTLEAVSGACAEPAVVRAALTAPLFGVIEGLRTGVQTLAFIQVTLHSKLIWRGEKKQSAKCDVELWLNLGLLPAQHQTD